MQRLALLIGAVGVVAFAHAAPRNKKRPKPPKVTKVIGIVADLGCAARGLAETGALVHSANDHTNNGGEVIAGCARTCLERGQPAALIDPTKRQITAIFACIPKPFARFAGDLVEVQGHWAGKGGSTAFIPLKIKKRADAAWVDVECGEMH